MNTWEVLGIECTTDVVIIKRAFAMQAKKYHPEEYPEEYKKLRNAYKKAIAFAKQQVEPETAPAENPLAKKPAQEKPTRPRAKPTELDMPRFEDFFREEHILEKPKTEKPRIDKNKIERPHIEAPHIEVPHLRELQEDKKTKIQEPVLKKTPVKPPRTEIKKPEMPSLKELIAESPVTETPVVEDPLIWQTQERRIKIQTPREIPKEFDFSFEEVERAYSPEEVEDFFYYFRAIASFPVLRDNVECWSLFLERPELRDFFRREDNCLRMIDTIEKYFWGEKDTLAYFEFFLGIKTGKHMEEFHSLPWFFKKVWGRLPKAKEACYLSPEESSLHSAITDELKKKDISDDLIHYETARIAYLEAFLEAVNENRGSRKQRWTENHKYRMRLGRKKLVGFMLPLMILGVILIGSLLWELISR